MGNMANGQERTISAQVRKGRTQHRSVAVLQAQLPSAGSAAPPPRPAHLSAPSRGPVKVLRGSASSTSCGRGREGTRENERAGRVRVRTRGQGGYA